MTLKKNQLLKALLFTNIGVNPGQCNTVCVTDNNQKGNMRRGWTDRLSPTDYDNRPVVRARLSTDCPEGSAPGRRPGPTPLDTDTGHIWTLTPDTPGHQHRDTSTPSHCTVPYTPLECTIPCTALHYTLHMTALHPVMCRTAQTTGLHYPDDNSCAMGRKTLNCLTYPTTSSRLQIESIMQGAHS